jgi:uncharacterized protein
VTLLETRHGPARIHRFESGTPRATIVLTHGAGGGIDARDLTFIAANATDLEVILFEMPWRVAEKKMAPQPKTLDQCWLDAFAHISRAQVPLIVGGRSAGARVAFRTAEEVGADAIFGLAFPLHPPGHPERSRVAELQVNLPVVIVQGARDPFGRPEEFPAGTPVYGLAGKGHELAADRLLLEALEALVNQMQV